MLTKHITLVSFDEYSISIDKSSEDILLTKKAKDAYSLIGRLVNVEFCFEIFTLILYYRIIGDKDSIRHRFSNFVF